MRMLYPACVLALIGALAGCGAALSGEDTGDRLPELGDVPRLTGPATPAYPLDEYLASDEELRLLERAQATLTEECMSRYGFAYRAELPPAPQERQNLRYGLADAQHAAEFGYALSTDGQEPARPELSLSEAEELVLFGPDGDDPFPSSWEEATESDAFVEVDGQSIPVGGCQRESYLKLYAPVPDSVDIMQPQSVEQEAYTRSLEDPRVREVSEEWSACMAEEGYAADDPVSPQTELGIDGLSSPEAVAAAEADVTCKAEVNLVGVWYAVEVAYQERALEENAEMLTSAREQHQDRMRLVAELTGAEVGTP
ncbi:hypothetical protein PJ985_02340 [Streptomyces sp. ACA25]|uniref:hypothetical protein n=1 Tax=Streptomyces sp. ACA25 TaxID=3022596 RepID=UPI0023075B32|nr:hypothetical protein [Streptomyces sp. ACA25]MDB1086414.1 hypothetical protein [Streptomyces sp. ACA25]